MSHHFDNHHGSILYSVVGMRRAKVLRHPSRDFRNRSRHPNRDIVSQRSTRVRRQWYTNDKVGGEYVTSSATFKTWLTTCTADQQSRIKTDSQVLVNATRENTQRCLVRTLSLSFFFFFLVSEAMAAGLLVIARRVDYVWWWI